MITELIKLPTGTATASEEIVKVLVEIGALYMDETGIHASNPGIYPKKKISLPMTDKSAQG